MSPEQARGDAVDARSDLFSLGSVMYAMCTGRPPFRAETSFGILQRISHDVPRANPRNQSGDSRVALPNRRSCTPKTRRAPSNRRRSQSVIGTCLAHVQQPAAVPLPEVLRIGPVSARARRMMRAIAAWRPPSALDLGNHHSKACSESSPLLHEKGTSGWIAGK